jgi:UDP-3-O-[3-hydroxymyristoyl] glucosamine N-acyltransferase
MADPRFFRVAGPFTLAEIAKISGAEVMGAGAADRQMSDVAALQDANENQVSFFDNRKYLDAFKATRAGAVFCRPEFVAAAPEGTVCLAAKNPYKAYALAAQAFYPQDALAEYRAPSAAIDPSAVIGKSCHIEHGAVIGRNVKMGDRCRIQAHAVIRDGVEMGSDCDIGPHAYLTHCVLGSKVRLHPGVSVGRPGFGFAIDPTGYVAVPQLGRVIIGDDVEIGANSTIDRGAGPDTVIGQGCRIDNLVQIGHNVQLGKFCVIVAQTGISGSTKLGDYVMSGGQSGFAGHISIGSGARIAAQSGIMRDIPPGVEAMGSPAVPIKQYMRQVATLSKMAGRKGSNDE